MTHCFPTRRASGLDAVAVEEVGRGRPAGAAGVAAVGGGDQRDEGGDVGRGGVAEGEAGHIARVVMESWLLAGAASAARLWRRKIGRAAWRARVCQAVSDSVVAERLKQNKLLTDGPKRYDSL